VPFALFFPRGIPTDQALFRKRNKANITPTTFFHIFPLTRNKLYGMYRSFLRLYRGPVIRWGQSRQFSAGSASGSVFGSDENQFWKIVGKYENRRSAVSTLESQLPRFQSRFCLVFLSVRLTDKHRNTLCIFYN